MKRKTALLLVIVMILTMTACAGKTPASNETSPEVTPGTASNSPAATQEPAQTVPIELIVFAAASMTETLTKIADMYKSAEPEVNLIFTFDSSGTLKTQIQEGADCDIFISAAQKQMNELDISSEENTEGLDFVLSESRFNLLENEVVLAVSKGNPAGIASFDDIATDRVEMLAIGNSDVPVGQYSEEILKNMGVWDKIQSKITFGSNVKEVTTWVKEGSVDCGIVYATDAHTAGLEAVAEAPAGMLKTPVLYPAAVLKTAGNQEAALDFLNYLKSDECADVFKAVGFSVPQ